MPFLIETCTAQHIGDRDEQQDRVGLFAHPVVSGALLAVVADGMGGLSGGALAAEQVVLTAKNNFLTSPLPAGEAPALLAACIREAHAAIRLAHLTGAEEPHSTAALLLIQRGRADWAHCGDSRIYHFRQGALIARSQDHSHVMELVRRGYLTEEQAAVHPQKNLLTSCLGDAAEPQIEYGAAQPMADGDCFLLCTDGLWAYLDTAELGRVLMAHPVRQAAEILIDTARTRAAGRGDNVSLAIVRIRAVVEARPVPPWRRKAVE